jgi:Tfp pilus assembly protein PilW
MKTALIIGIIILVGLCALALMAWAAFEHIKNDIDNQD